jgi:Ribonuclease G/E
MKGRQILIEPLLAGGHAAALFVDGRLEDLLIDPAPADRTPRPEAVFRALPGRPMKGTGGVILDLGDGLAGFLRGPKLPAAGRPLLVQVTGWAEPGKAPPVTTRLLLKARTAILTPDAPGINVARSLRDPGRRAELATLAETAMADAGPGLGLILRSAAAEAGDEEVDAEIASLRREWQALCAGGSEVGLLRPAPGAAAEAMRDWRLPGTALREAATALADAGVWEEVAALRQPAVPLGHGPMTIEPTRALVAIDVNTGGELSPAAALRTNLAAATEFPRQLRLRGLGGQVVIDFAPLNRADRPRVVRALTTSLRADGIDTAIVGWTPLGHLELQRKRARRPVSGA